MDCCAELLTATKGVGGDKIWVRLQQGPQVEASCSASPSLESKCRNQGSKSAVSAPGADFRLAREHAPPLPPPPGKLQGVALFPVCLLMYLK